MPVKLSLFSYNILIQIDEYIKECDLRGPGLRDAAADTLDGAIFLNEAGELRRKGLMKFVPDRKGPRPAQSAILGYDAGGSLELTKRAIGIFWPDRISPPNRKKPPWATLRQGHIT